MTWHVACYRAEQMSCIAHIFAEGSKLDAPNQTSTRIQCVGHMQLRLAAHSPGCASCAATYTGRRSVLDTSSTWEIGNHFDTSDEL